MYKWVDPLGDAIPLYNHSHPCIPHSVVNVLVYHLHVLAYTFLSAAAADCVSTHFFIYCRLIFLNLLHCELSPLGLNNHVLKCLLGCLVSGSVWVAAMLCGYGVLHACPVLGSTARLLSCANCVCIPKLLHGYALLTLPLQH